MYFSKVNIAVRSSKHFCREKATIRSLCCYCLQHKTAEPWHGSPSLDSLCTVVELQNNSYWCKQY
jgi:hypothetical protein